MTKKHFFSIAILAISFAALWFVFGVSCRGFSCLHFDGQREFVVQTVYENTPEIYRALYTRGSQEYMRIDVRERVEAGTAADYVHGRVAGMKALYDNIRSPYPGMLSNEIVCDEDFKPTYTTLKSENGVEIQEIVGYLNDRMTFGSCQKEEATYKGMMLLFACDKRRQFYQLEFIAPLALFSQERFESMSRSVRCK